MWSYSLAEDSQRHVSKFETIHVYFELIYYLCQLLTSSRGFTDEEQSYFERAARNAYDSFVSKAAASRNMTSEQMEEVCNILHIDFFDII